MASDQQTTTFDLPGRLRQWSDGALTVSDNERGYDRREDEREAAAEIERLQERIVELEADLRGWQEERQRDD